MTKAFGLCEACLKDDGQLMHRDTLKAVILKDEIHTVTVRTQKSKYLKCHICEKAKSAAYQLQIMPIDDASMIGEQLYLLSGDQANEKVKMLADWLQRESDSIAAHGCDYWVEKGILYFKQKGTNLEITFNDQKIKPFNVFELLNQ